MVDDLFCATALAGVVAVLAAGVWIGASDVTSPPLSTVAKTAVPVRVASPGRATTPAAMPVYDLPRVVISGPRSREGDMLAVEDHARDGRAGGR